MSTIVWLASYPKSGNTWFRALLVNLLRDAEAPADINDLDTGGMASSRPPLDRALGYDSSDLTADECDRLRPELYKRQALENSEPTFVKVHDAFTLLPTGESIFPAEATMGVVYLVRNPLDVCVSLSHHAGRSEFQKTIAIMNDPTHMIAAGTRGMHYEQLRQRMLDWSGHVNSWLNAPGHRVHLVRYEDLRRDTETFFARAAEFIGLPVEPARIKKAVKFSSFDELRSQEDAKGFRERLHADRKFFRKGKVGSALESLSKDQSRQLIDAHGEMMRHLGYLNVNGELTL